MTRKYTKIFYLLIPALILFIFFVDLVSLYSHVEIRVVSYFRELAIIALLFFWYHLLKKKLHFDELSIEQNLWRLFLLVLANYFIYFVLHYLLHPAYSTGFPPHYSRPGDIVLSTLLVLIATFTLVPSVLILRQLIFYKRKRNTAFLFNLFLISATVAAVLVYFLEKPVEKFYFRPETLPIDLTMLVVVGSILILSFQNEWLTYLPRRKKIIYFLVGMVFLGFTSSLYNAIYRKALPAYSLTLGALAYCVWLFLTIYGTVAFFKLFFQIPTARAFDRKLKELNSLYQFGRLLSSEQDYSRLVHTIVENTARILESDATWLQLFDPKTNRFEMANALNLTDREQAQNPLLLPEGLTRQIIQTRQTTLISDVPHNRQYRHLLRWKSDAQSIIGAPLFSNRGELMGILYATKPKRYSFDPDDASLLQGIANQSAIAMENLRLLQASLERERMEHELKIARDVQQRLLPQSTPHIPNFAIEAYCLSAYEVGGDYYDFFTYQDGSPGIVIADVSGKGTSAALYMAEFKGIIQSLAQYHESPASLARAVNRTIYPNIERKAFVSAIFLKLDPQQHTLSFVRAGHTPLIFRPEANKPAQILTPRGLGIGLDSGTLFDRWLEERKLIMQPGSLALVFTDGLTEARNAKGEELEEKGILPMLENNRMPLSRLREHLVKSVLEFCGNTPLHDDFTFVLVECCER